MIIIVIHSFNNFLFFFGIVESTQYIEWGRYNNQQWGSAYYFVDLIFFNGLY